MFCVFIGGRSFRKGRGMNSFWVLRGLDFLCEGKLKRRGGFGRYLLRKSFREGVGEGVFKLVVLVESY